MLKRLALRVSAQLRDKPHRDTQPHRDVKSRSDDTHILQELSGSKSVSAFEVEACSWPGDLDTWIITIFLRPNSGEKARPGWTMNLKMVTVDLAPLKSRAGSSNGYMSPFLLIQIS